MRFYGARRCFIDWVCLRCGGGGHGVDVDGGVIDGGTDTHKGHTVLTGRGTQCTRIAPLCNMNTIATGLSLASLYAQQEQQIPLDPPSSSTSTRKDRPRWKLPDDYDALRASDLRDELLLGRVSHPDISPRFQLDPDSNLRPHL
jgi:hypothetical protein